jgi:hypothetical protein
VGDSRRRSHPFSLHLRFRAQINHKQQHPSGSNASNAQRPPLFEDAPGDDPPVEVVLGGILGGIGEGVGSGVGIGVGSGVGIGVGIGVGTGVGEGVGEGVGCGVGSGAGTQALSVHPHVHVQARSSESIMASVRMSPISEATVWSRIAVIVKPVVAVPAASLYAVSKRDTVFDIDRSYPPVVVHTFVETSTRVYPMLAVANHASVSSGSGALCGCT